MPSLKEQFLRKIGRSAFPSRKELKNLYEKINPDNLSMDKFIEIFEDKYASTVASPNNMTQLEKNYKKEKEDDEALSWNDFMKGTILSRLMYPPKPSSRFYNQYHGGRKSRSVTRRKSRPATRRSTRRKSRSVTRRRSTRRKSRK